MPVQRPTRRRHDVARDQELRSPTRPGRCRQGLGSRRLTWGRNRIEGHLRARVALVRACQADRRDGQLPGRHLGYVVSGGCTSSWTTEPRARSAPGRPCRSRPGTTPGRSATSHASSSTSARSGTTRSGELRKRAKAAEDEPLADDERRLGAGDARPQPGRYAGRPTPGDLDEAVSGVEVLEHISSSAPARRKEPRATTDAESCLRLHDVAGELARIHVTTTPARSRPASTAPKGIRSSRILPVEAPRGLCAERARRSRWGVITTTRRKNAGSKLDLGTLMSVARDREPHAPS